MLIFLIDNLKKILTLILFFDILKKFLTLIFFIVDLKKLIMVILLFDTLKMILLQPLHSIHAALLWRTFLLFCQCTGHIS